MTPVKEPIVALGEPGEIVDEASLGLVGPSTEPAPEAPAEVQDVASEPAVLRPRRRHRSRPCRGRPVPPAHAPAI